MNPLRFVPAEASAFVTTTSAAPSVLDSPVTAVIEVADTSFTSVASTPPMDTATPSAKPDPVIVMAVPPASGPEDGVTVVTATVGAAVAGGDPRTPTADATSAATTTPIRGLNLRGSRSVVIVDELPP